MNVFTQEMEVIFKSFKILIAKVILWVLEQ